MYNLFLIDEFVYGYVSCTQNNLLYKIIAILKNEIAFWGGIVLPLILIIIGIVSFIKAITSKKEIIEKNRISNFSIHYNYYIE